MKHPANPTDANSKSSPVADGSVIMMAGLSDGDTTPRPLIHNGQSQIDYDTQEEE